MILCYAASLLSEYFLQTSMQHLTAKGAADNLTLRINEDIVGDRINLIYRSGGTLKTFQIRQLHPGHFDLLDSFYPCFLLLVERDRRACACSRLQGEANGERHQDMAPAGKQSDIGEQ